MKYFVFLLSFSILGNVLHAHPGIGLVYDGHKNIYFTDLNHVWKLDTHTGLSEIAVRDVHSHELLMDSKGNLFGEHYWYEASESQFKNYIWKLDRNRKLSIIRDTQYGENRDFGFVRDQKFNAYDIRKVGQKYQIIRRDSSNATVLHTSSVLNASWCYLAADGTFYFTDQADLLALKNGKLSTIAGDLSSSRIPFSIQSDDHSLYGIWTDHLSNIYVAVYGGRVVKKIDRDGQITTVLKTGFLRSPLNGVYDKENNLWLMESTLNGKIRVRKVEADLLVENTSFLFENILILLLVVILIRALFLVAGKRLPFLGRY